MPDAISRTKVRKTEAISLQEPHEVQYWADKFGASKEQLSEELIVHIGSLL